MRIPLRAVLVVAAVALVAGCTRVAGIPAEPEAPLQARVPRAPVVLRVGGERSSPGVVVSGGMPAPYNYGPTVLQEDGQFRTWWCSQLPDIGPPGDDVLYAASGSLDGPFTAAGGAPAVPVFAGRPGAFDAMHTCDPSVLRVGGRYYLYYTGAAGEHAHGNAIGVASSTDGRAWRREAGGAPIVTASREVSRENVYGAGQPSALYLDGWFYLMFTDTTASGAGWNGAGQFVLRARNPEFTDQLQSLTEEGFVPGGARRSRSVVDAFSADWAWVPALNAFAIAHQTATGTSITFWDRGFTRHPYEPVVIPGPWQEGPGLVRQPDGSAVVSSVDPCGTVPFDVLRATALLPAPTDVRRFGIDVQGVDGCATPQQAAAVLDGFGVPSPSRTVDVVRGGQRIRFERRSVAERLVTRVLDKRVSAVDALPVVATIASGARALRSPQGVVGLLDDEGRLWTVTPEAAEANGSAITDVSQQDWNSHPQAGNLHP
ncbi:beta-xylosidase [Saccharopolyspora subtropica]|uniref:Beta-xylosidase n=1 Tax=Saccharopolyspora thermophila TaxID=89367 RepID=A0A917NE73_9PSEU|nr:beta-xylosidase [Saccharopolyspora subtropica]GGI94424.1 beta-xylosidase [Saccharopolyspora subtropica]